VQKARSNARAVRLAALARAGPDPGGNPDQDVNPGQDAATAQGVKPVRIEPRAELRLVQAAPRAVPVAVLPRRTRGGQAGGWCAGGSPRRSSYSWIRQRRVALSSPCGGTSVKHECPVRASRGCAKKGWSLVPFGGWGNLLRRGTWVMSRRPASSATRLAGEEPKFSFFRGRVGRRVRRERGPARVQS